ncbi:MAG: site-2 protease family protein [Cytophagales bacterium]|nr:site-2 protease family protein [Cytophagales bacterium]
METVYYYLLGILFIYCVYIFGKFFIALRLGIYDKEVFLGFGSYSAIRLKFKEVTVHIGLFIPLPFFAQFNSYQDGIKQPITYEWQFFDQPWYLRVLAAFGGAISALIASILLFSILAFIEKDTYLPKEELNKHGISPSEFAYEEGFMTGDKILLVNGEDYERWSDLISPRDISNEPTVYEVSRNGKTQKLSISWLEFIERGPGEYLFSPNGPFKVGTVTPGGQADVAGIQARDVIQSINGQPVESFYEARDIFQEFSDETITLVILRDSQSIPFQVRVSSEGKIGFYPEMEINYTTRSRSVFEALAIGIVRPFSIMGVNFKAFGKIFSGKIDSRRSLSGPVGISGLFDNGIQNFFNVSAILLVMMFLWDFMPLPKSAALKSIPVLIEVLFKKQVSLQVYNNIYKGGWALIMIMMIGTIINDILNFI